MVSALDSGSSAGIMLCSWARHTVPLFTQEYMGTGKMLEQPDNYARGYWAIAALCYGNQSLAPACKWATRLWKGCFSSMEVLLIEFQLHWQFDIRTLCVNHWGSEQGITVLKQLGQLYMFLIWETIVLETISRSETSPEETKAVDKDLEMLRASTSANQEDPLGKNCPVKVHISTLALCSIKDNGFPVHWNMMQTQM